MLGSRLRTGAIALLFGAAGLLLMPGGAGAEARRTTARAPGQTSIPSTPAAATTTVPQDPYLAPDGTGYVHNDSYQSDTYTWSGPPAGSTRVRARSLGGQCAPAAVDSAGRLVTACQQSSGIQLLLINPTTLKTLASFGLPATDILRFGYFFLDNQDRVVIPTPTGQIWTIAETSNGGVPGFSLVGSVDLSSHLADSTDWIFSVLPDWSGRQWFQSHEGVVGWVDPTSGAVSTLSLGEQITNSAAIDETGGVFVVTDHALYRIDPDPSSGAPV
ncbi:MAG TPA: hypothetical protein VF972_01235, partial [Actinomycetota bacterium]